MHSFFETIHDVDMTILDWLGLFKGPLLDKMMIIITEAGEFGLIWFILALILIAQKKFRLVGLISLLALILGALMTDVVLKNAFSRLRPYTFMSDFKLLINEPSSFSFPSSHATTSFAFAGVIAYYIKSYRFTVLFFASLMSFTRMYLYVHFASDVIAGILVGLGAAALAILTFKVINLENESNLTIKKND